jgi:hypothetical protein
VVSVDGTVPVAASSLSVVSAEAAAAVFFLLARGVAGFFFSPAGLLLLRDFGGRVSGTTIGVGLSSGDDGDVVVGADVGALEQKIIFFNEYKRKIKREIYLLMEDAGVGGIKGNG